MADKFSPHMKAVAIALWGDPNKKLSKPKVLRWGDSGARVVDVDRGVWSDHAIGDGPDGGGGVLDLIIREKGFSKQVAAEWMEKEGYISPDPSSGSAGYKEPSNRNYGPQHDPDDPGYNDAPVENDSPPDPKAEIVKTYDYVDETEKLVYQVCRLEVPGRPDIAKTFRQRTPDPSARGGWSWKVKGVRQVPYRLPELLKAIADRLLIFIVEGEKDVDRLRSMGIPATCNAGGAGKWADALSPVFSGARVILVPDDDPQMARQDGTLLFHDDGRPKHAGQDHSDLVGERLTGVADSVEIVHLPHVVKQAKRDTSDWLDDGNDAAKWYEIIDTAIKWTKPFKSRFRAIPWADLGNPGFEHEWLVKGLLTRRERSMVAGPSQAGKSFFCLDIAMAIARNIPFFGHKVAHPGGVIYQAGEGGRGIKKRLTAYMIERGLTTEDNIPFVLMPAAIDLYAGDDHTNAFIAEVKHYAATFNQPLEMIVIDTLSTASTGANENASEDMSRVLSRVERIEEETKAHVMLVHHLNADGTKPRGHTSIFANLENVIEINLTEEVDSPILITDHKDGNQKQIRRQIRRAKVTKQKDGESGEGIDFVLHSVLLDTDVDGDPVTSCTIEAPERAALENVTIERDKGVNLTPQCHAYLSAVIEALKQFSDPAYPDTGEPHSTRVVMHKHVKNIFENTTFEVGDDDDPEKKREAIKKAISRHGAFLMKNGILKKHDKVVWLSGKKVKGLNTNDPNDPPPSPPDNYDGGHYDGLPF